MPKTRVITFGLVTALLTCLPALAASKSVAESRMILDGSYPTSERHVLVVPADIENDVNVCVGTAHDIKKAPNEGYNTAKITISRPDPETDEVSVEKHGKRGTLSGNKWLRCIITGPLAAGDTIEFDYVFSGYRKPRGATIHVRSTVSEGRMLISELRGIEAQGNTGEPTQYHQRVVSAFARNGKHPKLLQQGFVVHADSLGKVRFCVGYGNTIVKKPGDGNAVITVDIGRTDPETGEVEVETLALEAGLEDNKINECIKIDQVRKGDTVVVDVELAGFPRLRGNTEIDGVAMGGEAFEIRTGIGPNKMLTSEILGPPSASGGTGGGSSGGGGGGGAEPTNTGQVSAADQKAISAMSKLTAISVGNRVRGAGRTFLIGHRHNCANLMEAPTIAAVYAKYVKACGARSTGGALTNSEIAAIAKLVKMKHTSAIRWESGGRVLGEYWTQATGTRHISTNTIEKAVAWLVSQGRLP